jgi:hypothetical protein
MVLLASGMAFLATPALAQSTSTTQNAPAASGPTTNTPATDAIGPRELQNFSLPGTATRPAEQQPSTATTPAPSTETAAPNGSERRLTQRRQIQAEAQPKSVAPAPVPVTQAPPSSLSPTVPAQITAPAPAIASPTPPAPAAVAPAPQNRPSILPWLIASLLLAGGTAFLLWRRRPRESYAGARQFDLFEAPRPDAEPAAQPDVRWMPPPAASEPVPAPAPPLRVPEPPQRPAAEASRGIVASRLRPALEIGVRPLRCVVEDSQVTLEFELDLFNAGTAPARAILAEASLLNASATQDQELAAFFSRPAAVGEPLETIPPMRRMTMTSQVVAPRAAIQEYDLGGRKAFVPVIAFNAMYEWSSGKAQTSAAYLVGRETSGDKLGPLRLDDGRREVRGLGARSLPVGVRS